MKKSISIIMASIMLLTLAACGNNSDGNGGENNQSADKNLSEGYNFIQPDVKLGSKLDEMPEGTVADALAEGVLYYGANVEFQGVTYKPMYNWMDSDGQNLSSIDYNSMNTVTDDEYKDLLGHMSEKYGEGRKISDIEAERQASLDATGTDDPYSDLDEEPSQDAEVAVSPDATGETNTPESSDANSEQTATDDPATTDDPNSSAYDDEDNPFPALSWRSGSIDISLFYRDGFVSVTFIKNSEQGTDTSVPVITAEPTGE